MAATWFAVYHFKGYLEEDDAARYVERTRRYSEENKDKPPAERKNKQHDTGDCDGVLQDSKLGFTLVAARDRDKSRRVANRVEEH